MNHTGRRPISICVLIDALGWKILEERPFLNDLLPYRQPLRTVLGYSSGAIPTLLTGTPPSHHGHWNLFYYDPDGSPFAWLRWLHHLPDWLVNHRVSQKLIKEAGRNIFHMGSQFECYVKPSLMPYFNWVERRCIYKPGGIAGANSIFDDLEDDGIPYRAYSYHDWSDEQILAHARNDIEHSNAEFFFIYLCQLDAELHAFWAQPERLQSMLSRYENKLREIFVTAQQIDPNASMAICSDHGMAPVTGRFDLVKEVDALGWEVPRDYLAVYDSTMARFWFFNDEARNSIHACLVKQQCGRVLCDSELEELGVYFPDHRFGGMIFLLDSGWMFYRSDFHSGNWLPNGMHGYHPDDPYSDAVFLSNHRPERPLINIRDLHGYMKDVSGLSARQFTHTF